MIRVCPGWMQSTHDGRQAIVMGVTVPFDDDRQTHGICSECAKLIRGKTGSPNGIPTQDSLGRIMAPLPGLSKLEFIAIMLLPGLLERPYIKAAGQPVSMYKAAILAAKELLNEFEKLNENQNENTTKIIS